MAVCTLRKRQTFPGQGNIPLPLPPPTHPKNKFQTYQQSKDWLTLCVQRGYKIIKIIKTQKQNRSFPKLKTIHHIMWNTQSTGIRICTNHAPPSPPSPFKRVHIHTHTHTQTRVRARTDTHYLSRSPPSLPPPPPPPSLSLSLSHI